LGRSVYPAELTTSAAAETVFILLATKLFPPLMAGIVMAGILAATISSADSYLLIAASAFAKNIYGLVKKDVTDKQVMQMSRIILIVLTLIGIIIAMDEKSIIFQVVSFAWAGFGATFGPLMLFSLFWRRVTRKGAIAGMLAGGITVFVWKLLIKPMGGVFGIYELLPAFIVSALFIIGVSLMDKAEDQTILKEFDEVRQQSL
jgi:sodium/proline symporter